MTSAEPKTRLDLLLVQRGLAETRAKAAALILAGQVVVGENRVDKPGVRVASASAIRIKGPDHSYVSRGGVKLAGALDFFSIPVTNLIVLDVGASTGGFSDCLLQRGAARIFALDVGRGQIHAKLRADPRVLLLESFNVRDLSPQRLPAPVDMAVFDVSFISLKLALAPVLPCLKANGLLLLLVKPQFEVGKGQVGKGGIVRDETLRQQALDSIVSFAAAQGLSVRGTCESCLPGTDGNIEYFVYLQKQSEP